MYKMANKFLDEKTTIDYSVKGIYAKELYRKYCDWCKENNYFILDLTVFGKCASKKYEKVHLSKGNLYINVKVL